MATLKELADQQNSDVINLRRAALAVVGRLDASARVREAKLVLKEMQARDTQAQMLRTEQIADLDQRPADLTDEVVVAQHNLELAKINATYKPSALAVKQAEEAVAEAERTLVAAVAEEESHPLPDLKP